MAINFFLYNRSWGSWYVCGCSKDSKHRVVADMLCVGRPSWRLFLLNVCYAWISHKWSSVSAPPIRHGKRKSACREWGRRARLHPPVEENVGHVQQIDNRARHCLTTHEHTQKKLSPSCPKAVQETWAPTLGATFIGDHQPYTATTKDFGSKKGFRRGWCTNCHNPREQQNVYHPQDCTGDVHHGFCGGGVRIVGFEFRVNCYRKTRSTDPNRGGYDNTTFQPEIQCAPCKLRPNGETISVKLHTPDRHFLHTHTGGVLEVGKIRFQIFPGLQQTLPSPASAPNPYDINRRWSQCSCKLGALKRLGACSPNILALLPDMVQKYSF